MGLVHYVCILIVFYECIEDVAQIRTKSCFLIKQNCVCTLKKLYKSHPRLKSGLRFGSGNRSHHGHVDAVALDAERVHRTDRVVPAPLLLTHAFNASQCWVRIPALAFGVVAAASAFQATYAQVHAGLWNLLIC